MVNVLVTLRTLETAGEGGDSCGVVFKHLPMQYSQPSVSVASKGRLRDVSIWWGGARTSPRGCQGATASASLPPHRAGSGWGGAGVLSAIQAQLQMKLMKSNESSLEKPSVFQSRQVAFVGSGVSQVCTCGATVSSPWPEHSEVRE